MARHGAARDSRDGRGAHRAEPTGGGPFAALGRLLGSTVPKRVQPPRFLRVLTVSGLLVGLMMFGYSTTQVYLRFTEPPVDRDDVGSAESDDERLAPTEPGSAEPEGSDSERTGSRSVPGDGLAVSYSMTESEEADFAGQLVIINSGSEALRGWEVEVAFAEARVVAAWDVEWEPTAAGARFTDPEWEDGIAPGDSKAIAFTVEGTPQTPECTFNGDPCGIG